MFSLILAPFGKRFIVPPHLSVMRLLDKAGHFVLLIYEKSALKTLVLISVSSVVEWLTDDVFPPAAVPTGLGSSPLRLSEAAADVLYKS